MTEGGHCEPFSSHSQRDDLVQRVGQHEQDMSSPHCSLLPLALALFYVYILYIRFINGWCLEVDTSISMCVPGAPLLLKGCLTFLWLGVAL